MMKTSRIQAFVMAVLFFLSVVIVPKPAQAIAHVIPLVATAVIQNGARVTLTGPALTGLVTLAGAAISYFSFNSGGMEIMVPAGSYENSEPLMPVSNPNAPANVSPSGGGWGDQSAENGPWSRCVMSSVPGWMYMQWNCVASYSDLSVCQELISAPFANGTAGRACINANKVLAMQNPDDVPLPGSCEVNYPGRSCLKAEPSGCPAGYTSNGTGCSLTERRLVNDDLAVQYRDDVTGSFEQLPDADVAPPSVTVKPNGDLMISGYDEAGRPMAITVSPMAGGVRNIEIAKGSNTGTGANVVQKESAQIEPAGNVVSAVSAAPAPGVIENPGTASAAVTVTGPAAQLTDVVFPTDYARQGEAAAAAGIVAESINTAKNEILATDTVGDPELPDWSDPWSGTFADILGWRLPSHNGNCPTLSIDAFDQTSIMTSHCQLIDDNRPLLSAVMSVVWTLMALFIILGA